MVQIIKQISQRREAVCGLNGYAKVGGGSPGGGDGDDFCGRIPQRPVLWSSLF